MRSLLAAGFFALVACGGADYEPSYGAPPDPFHARVMTGCRSEPECAALHEEATIRRARCAPRGADPRSQRCADASADAQITDRYVRWYYEQGLADRKRRGDMVIAEGARQTEEEHRANEARRHAAAELSARRAQEQLAA